MKNNNRGFSLVELIVVVLIMAIIAVALAPQVMKWVHNSRLASDVQTRDTLKEQCELALTDNAAFNKVKDGGYSITMTKTGANEPVFSYTEAGGTPITSPSITDVYWKSLLEKCGVNDFDQFEKLFTIKSDPGNGSIVIKVDVYEEGYTRASLTGIEGNDDINVS